MLDTNHIYQFSAYKSNYYLDLGAITTIDFKNKVTKGYENY